MYSFDHALRDSAELFVEHATLFLNPVTDDGDRYTEVITNPMTLDLARRLRCKSDQFQPKGQD